MTELISNNVYFGLVYHYTNGSPPFIGHATTKRTPFELLQNLKDQLFYRTSLGDCFWFHKKKDEFYAPYLCCFLTDVVGILVNT